MRSYSGNVFRFGIVALLAERAQAREGDDAEPPRRTKGLSAARPHLNANVNVNVNLRPGVRVTYCVPRSAPNWRTELRIVSPISAPTGSPPRSCPGSFLPRRCGPP